MLRLGRLIGAGSLAIALAIAAGCPKASTEAPAANGEKSPGTPPDDVEEDVPITQVYPKTKSAPPSNPLAARLCRWLHAEPAKRKSECCTQPDQLEKGKFSEQECTRMLTASLANGASTLSEGQVDACQAAMQSRLEGCDWVRPRAIMLPGACVGLIDGTLDEGARCRSNLECKDGLHCRNLSPTTFGVCKRPAGTRSTCDTGQDPLAGFTLQSDVDQRHPMCTGFCSRHRCQPKKAPGEACASNLHCAPDGFCDGAVCVAGDAQVAGGSCADGGCPRGLACVDHVCVEPGGKGQSCTNDLQCLGGCDKSAGEETGVCGMQCRPRFPYQK